MYFTFLLILSNFAYSAEVIEKVVAIVNDQTILLSDIDKQRARLQKSGMVDDLLVSDAKAIIGNRDAIVDLIISEKLIDSEVQRQNLSVTTERVDAEIKQIAQQNGISKIQLRQALKEQGTDFAEYQNFIKKRIERHALIEKAITSKIKISDEDAAAYFIQTKGEAAGKDAFQYRLAHILFLPKGGDVAGAEERAKSVLNKLAEQKSFETLASQHSEDPNFSPGGALGTFKSGEFLPEIEKAVQGLSVNQTTGVVKTRIGFHVVKLLEKTLIPSPEFEQAKPRVQAYLAEQAFKRQFSFWISQKRQEAFVRKN